MRALLTEEQELLRDVARRLSADIAPEDPSELDKDYDLDAASARLAQAGLVDLVVSADPLAGVGVEIAVVVEELARRTCPVPYLGTTILAAGLVQAAGGSTHEAAGTAVALDDDLADVLREGSNGVAWDARGARAALVLAGDPHRPHLVAVPCGAEIEDQIDLTRTLCRVGTTERIDLGDLGGGIDPEALTRWTAVALAAVSADLVGVMQGALERAVAHARTRSQFGAPIGSFQAIQHLCADQLVTLEAARSSMLYAAWAAAELEPRAALLAGRTAKAYCSRAGRQVTEATLQVHGGMGFTWEHPAHLHVRRALLDRLTFGDEDAQLRGIAELRRR